MHRRHCWRDIKAGRWPDFIGLKLHKLSFQLFFGNTPENIDGVCERPRVRTRVQLRNLRINGDDIWPLSERSKYLLEDVYAWMLREIASDGTEIVIAVEETGDGNQQWLVFSGELFDEGVTFGDVHFLPPIVVDQMNRPLTM